MAAGASPTHSQAAAAAAAAAPFEAAEDGGAAEHMLMVALETLYKDAGEADVQLGILRVVLQILQRHGECQVPLSKPTEQSHGV